ncbi:unnamed protein product [Penicillium camemberti]|uniref:Str. FM013 n=1 Tax=Penicillium camemberti (strain FM 013) TaxID=1429867 RepID=A0A0G4P0I5_PENC3|nr:unnamed protein product [Penicillium camemberti]
MYTADTQLIAKPTGLGLALFLPNASSIYDLPDPPANQNPISIRWPGGKPGINKF